MNSLNTLKTAFWSRKFLIAAILFSLVALFGNLTAVSGQSPYSLKFNRVRVFNGLNENGSITSERYDATGGNVEINVNGNAFGFCPGGSERLRFTWSFIGGNVLQVGSSSDLRARLDISQISRSQPCTTSYLDRTEFWIQGSNGSSNPFTAEENRRIDGKIFNDRARITGASSNTLGIKTADKAASGTEDIAWFEITIGTSAGSLRYVYLYDIVRGGAVTYGNIAGAWESDYSGSWKPTSIRQEGNRLWFTNEFGDTSEGVYESAGRVRATKWNVGATVQDSNTIKWDNGTTWRKGRSGGTTVSIENDTDRPGADYANYDLPQPDVESCRSACAKDSRCKAFTYVKPSVQGANARCWLKSSVPPGGPSGCCISGVKTGFEISENIPSELPARRYETALVQLLPTLRENLWVIDGGIWGYGFKTAD